MTAAAPPTPAQRICDTLRATLIERRGPNGVREVYRAIAASADDSANAGRAVLAKLGVRLPDDEFDALASSLPTATALFNALCGEMHPRRLTVVGLAWRLLSRLAEAGEDAPAVPTATLHAYYDPHRFPEVVGLQLTEAEALEAFQECFSDDTNPDGLVTKDEFTAYYCGQSHLLRDHRAFELLLMRSWNLDRGTPKPREEALKEFGTIPVSTLGRSHPLYQTSAGAVGTQLDKAFAVDSRFRRAGKFTKSEPPPAPSSRMNTAVARSKVI